MGSRSLEHALCNNIHCPMECSVVGNCGYGDGSKCDRCGSEVTVYECADCSWAGIDDYECRCSDWHETTFGKKNIKMEHTDFKEFKWCVPSWGLEINNGWLNLVYELCQKLDDMVEYETGDSKFQVAQIKEKFGGLRFYVYEATKEMYDLINEYEEKSYRVCEVCGKPGYTRPTGYITTVCRKHFINAIQGELSMFPFNKLTWYPKLISRLWTYFWNWVLH